jgi:hypothetical protein
VQPYVARLDRDLPADLRTAQATASRDAASGEGVGLGARRQAGL